MTDAEGSPSPQPGATHGGRTSRTLAEKVDHLFATVHPARGEFSYEHVATSIKDAGGPTISAAYIWMLRKGQRDNPTMKHLEALSGFFGVPAAYFFDDDLATQVDEQLALVAALRDVEVRKVAMRASGLSRESLGAIRDMIEQVRRLEGLAEPSPDERDTAGESGQGHPQQKGLDAGD